MKLKIKRNLNHAPKKNKKQLKQKIKINHMQAMRAM